MHDYDFSALNDKEFEYLALDLLQREHHTPIERFKPGPDNGIDGRFFTHNALGPTIIQVKHWLRSGYSALRAHMKKSECPKIKTLSPNRYIFVTSVPLSPSNKKQLINDLFPYVQNSTDIYGRDDLNALLAKHPDIERNHYKLWICSSEVLETILHYDILGRTKDRLRQLRDLQAKYVITSNHNRALDLLDSKHAAIITGEPGIGKTTLANSLCLAYAAQSFQPIFLEESVTEAESVYREEERQLFYFDDFLGSNYLAALNNDSDSHIVNFVSRVQRDPTKRLILTSRTNIMKQGWRLTDRFAASNMDRNNIELLISDLTDLDKARILYNHIWFGGLTEEFIDQIYANKRYRKIIKHKNFNPRLIGFITDPERFPDLPASEYWKYVSSMLDNPYDIWRTAFDSQLDDMGRTLVLLVVFNGSRILEDTLKKAYNRMLQSGIISSAGNIRKDFAPNVRTVTGSYLNRNADPGNIVYYTLFSPSIADFVLRQYGDDIETLKQLLLALQTLESARTLKSIRRADLISERNFSELLRTLTTGIPSNEAKHVDFWITIHDYNINRNNIEGRGRKRLSEFLQSIDLSSIGPYAILSFFDLCSESINRGIVDFNEEFYEEVIEALNEWTIDDRDLEVAAEFISNNSANVSRHSISRFSNIATRYWQENIEDQLKEMEEISEVTDESERARIIEIAEGHLEDIFKRYSGLISEDAVQAVLDYVDADAIVSENIDRCMQEDFESDPAGEPYSAVSHTDDAIDDLFDRS